MDPAPNSRQLPPRPPPRPQNSTTSYLGPELTREQKQELFTQGFLVLKNYVPKEVLDPALRLINQELGYGLSKEEMEDGAKGTYCKRISSTTQIANLFNSSHVYGAVKQLIPKTTPTYGGQIALRFPGQLCTDREHFIPSPWWNSGSVFFVSDFKLRWHLDGFSDPNNGIKPGEIKNFTALIGIALSDAPEDFCGNLVVYPRSHFILQKYFRENGFEQSKKGLHELPGIQLPPPIQVHMNKGDAVIAQYMLAHSIAPNTSPNVRYQVYFRVNAREGDFHHPEPMLNMWMDWEGLKDIVQTQKEEIPICTGSSQVSKPYYVDQRRKKEFAEILEKDQKLNEVKKKAEALFDSHQWEAAQPLWVELADHFANDWVIQLKAALCFAFGKEENVRLGEKYCKNLITLSPLMASGYCIYAASLNRQKRFHETVEMAKRVLTVPPSADKDTIKGLMEAVTGSMVELKTPEKEINDFVEVLLSLYPQFEELIRKIHKEINKITLWKLGHEWLHSPNKDLIKEEKTNEKKKKQQNLIREGESIFQQIITIDPTDVWGTLLYGGCLTWNKKFSEGETYLRRVLELDPNIPHGYSVLAQNQLAQGKHENVIKVVEQMFQKKFPTVETDNDHKEKIFEALDCVKQVKGLNSNEIKNFISIAKQYYPSLTPQFTHFEKTGNKDENCVIQ